MQAHVSLGFPMCAAAEESSWEGDGGVFTIQCGVHIHVCFLRKLAGRKGMCKHIQNYVQALHWGCLLPRPWGESTNYSASLPVSKARPREVQSLAEGHLVSKWPTLFTYHFLEVWGARSLSTTAAPELCTNQT